jgi:glycosyltransferase involved in cell wall biosynthesis
MSDAVPDISVIVPVFNGQRFLRGAIENVLGQGRTDLEILVVDDGSTDSSPAIAQDFGSKVRVLQQANAGPSAARNAGLAQARGRIIGFLDVDDRWPEGHLARMLPEFDIEPLPQVVMGYVKWRFLARNPEDEKFYQHCRTPFAGPYLGSALFRREVFANLGAFDASLIFSEDVDLFNRIKEENMPIRFVKELALIYQRHEHNMTRGKMLHELNTALVMKRSLDRRRARGKGTAAEIPAVSDYVRSEEQ